VIIQGFVNFHIPVWIRRLVTVAPAFGAVLLGLNPTKVLVLSQVVLSIAFSHACAGVLY
jgi:manganese transport protein